MNELQNEDLNDAKDINEIPVTMVTTSHTTTDNTTKTTAITTAPSTAAAVVPSDAVVAMSDEEIHLKAIWDELQVGHNGYLTLQELVKVGQAIKGYSKKIS